MPAAATDRQDKDASPAAEGLQLEAAVIAGRTGQIEPRASAGSRAGFEPRGRGVGRIAGDLEDLGRVAGSAARGALDRGGYIVHA